MKILPAILILVSISTLAFAEFNPEIEWKFTAKEGINSIYVSDLENDGNIEIAITASIDGMVYILDSKGEVKWKYNLVCPVSRVYAADLDNDGKQEVMMSSCEYLTITDSYGAKKGQIHSWRGVKDAYASDIDGDNFKEVIATINPSPYTNGISVIDETGKKKWSYNMEEKPYSVYASDIDNDNKKEVMVGAAEKEERFFKSGRVYLLNSTGGMLWNFKTAGGVNYVYASDIDNDGSNEILVGSYQRFYVLDRKGNLKWDYATGGYIYKIEVSDIDNDGNKEMIVGSNDLYVFDKNGNLKWKDRVGTEVYDIFVDDIDNDGNLEILVGSDRVYIFNQKGDLDWKSEEYLSVKGVYAIDLNKDGFNEIIAGTLDKNLYVFETINYAKTRLGSSYYERAQNFYTSKDYENASRYARMAKGTFSEIGDGDGISKSELLISQIEKLSLRIGEDSRDADKFYKTAQDFYFSRDYLNASAYARMARDKYSSVGDTEGISKSNSLIGNINTGLKADASEYYANATKRFNLGDYNGAISDAKKTRAIYKEIKSVDDALKTDLLIAKVYLKLAEKQYESNNFADAGRSAQKSRFIYLCIESGSLNCDSDSIADIKSVVNETYNESAYKEELMQISSLIGKISEKNTGEFNLTDPIRILGIVALSLILLYLGVRAVKKNAKGKNRKNSADPKNSKGISRPNQKVQPSDSEIKKLPSEVLTRNIDYIATKNFPKKFIKNRFKGVGLQIKIGKISK